MRGFRSTAILFGVLLALAAYLYFSHRQPPPSAAGEQALAVPTDSIGQITIAVRDGDTTTLTRTGQTWRITAPISAKADEGAVVAIASALRSVAIERVVDEAPPSVVEFGLKPPRVDVAVTQTADKNVYHLLLGNASPLGGVYARTASDHRLLLVGRDLETTFTKSTFDLRSKSAIDIDRDAIDVVEMSARGRRVRLVRHDVDWRMEQPIAADGDLGVVSDLLTKLTTNAIRTVIAQSGSDLKPYGLDAPQSTATLRAGSSAATIQVGRGADEATTYARDESRDLVFTIDRTLADLLQKPAAAFRRKDLFLFQPLDATRLEITRNGETTVYEKAAGRSGAEAGWRAVSPSPRDVDPARMRTALEKLSFIRAIDFVDRPALGGATAADLSVTVKYDEGKKEDRVTLRADSGTGPIAARAEWPDAAKLDPNAYGLLTAAIEDLKK